jgi:Flp pilus assembly protein TadD
VWRMSFGVRRWALAIICFVPTASALGQIPSSIQIFMPNGGLPPRAIRVTIFRDEGYTDIVFTDSKGKLDLPTPRAQSANYRITIESDKQTYDTTTASFSLERNNPNQITIFLEPLLAEKRPGDAVLDVNSSERNVPSKARAAYKRAMESIGKGQYESAINSLQQAISLYPQYVRALNDLGVIFLKQNRFDEAIATFRQAIAIDKRFFHARVNLGVALNKKGKYREALEVLGPLYDENHEMIDVRLAYANALEGAGELSEAEKIYRSTLESKSLSTKAQADTHFTLGVLLNRQGRFADAVRELEKAIALDHDAPNSYLQLGAALIQLQQLERAERALLRAYELGGNSAGGAQLLLGQIYYTQKRFGDAQRAFEQYLKDVPSAPNASQITQLIANLKAASKN